MTFYVGALYTFEDTSEALDVFNSVYTNYTRYPVVFSNSSNFNSICADNNASIDNGTIQITTMDGLFVIDLKNKVPCDWCTTTIKGSANELIEQTDIVDLNIGG